jgi:hypothetical protein
MQFKLNRIAGFIIILLCFSIYVSAQKYVNPNFQTHRLDYRPLGYPDVSEIPADNAPISALLAHSNGKVYGATSGKQSYLFTYNYLTNKVSPLGKIANSKGVHHSLVEDSNGLIYIGTGLNEIKRFNLSRKMPHGKNQIEKQLWKDIKNRYKGYNGGHLFVYNPKIGDKGFYLENDTANVTDLGIPVPGNSIYTMEINQKKNKIYGISYPDAIFFEYDIINKSFKTYGKWMTSKSYHGPERCWRSVPRSLVCTSDGKVYASGDGGLMHYFDPETEKIKSTSMRIPGEYWITQHYKGYPVVEQLIMSKRDSGIVYGSTCDGYIFKANLTEEKIINLGKPMVARRVRAMTLGKDQRLYIICGEKSAVCRMFSYHTSEDEGFFDYGVLSVDHSPHYLKIGYQFDAMCTAKDGTIFIGESARRAKLFFYIPGGSVVDGMLNPTNPR